MAVDQVAAEQCVREEQDHHRKRKCSPRPGSIPRCHQFRQPRDNPAFHRGVVGHAHSLRDQAHQDKSHNQQYRLDRTRTVSHFYLMFSGPHWYSAEIRIHAKYWRGLSINGGLLAWKVSDLEQRIASTYDCPPRAIGPALFALC